MPDAGTWLAAVRNSQDRFAAVVAPLGADEVRAPAYPDEWSIADTASHLGSQAEIFALFLAAGLDGTPAPGGEVFGPIWDRWNALPPDQQVSESVAANEAFVRALEAMPADVRDGFALAVFGMDLDLAGLAALRLGEHALHTWDIAVALDPHATLSPDVVELLIDRVADIAQRAGVAVEGAAPVAVITANPERHLMITLDPAVTVMAVDRTDAALALPAEAVVRLCYGRLDVDHAPDVLDPRLDALRSAFPGF